VDNSYKFIIDCVACSLGSDNKLNIDNNVDYMHVFKCSSAHSITPIVYDGIKKLGIVLPDEVEKVFSKKCRMYTMQYVMQDEQLCKLTDIFEKNKIKNMPLKGSILRKMYPRPELRTSSDLDILYDETYEERVAEILLGLGYKVGEKAAKDTSYLLPPFVNVEMHCSLMGDHPELEGDFADVWDRVSLVDGKEYTYAMSNEDFYVYMITHAAKHYLMGGIGIRFVIDAWVFNNYIGDRIDTNVVNERLAQLGVSVFNQKLISLANYWFNGSDADEATKALGDFICDCNTFGATQNRVAGQIASKGKIKFMLDRVFPQYDIMCSYYPKLKQNKVLLPYFWCKRIIRGAFNRNSTFHSESEISSNISDEKINSIKELNDSLGFNEKSLRY